MQPLQKMPARWRQSISFATTVSIPYDELENTRTLSKGFFGEVFEGVWRKPDAPPVEVVVRVVSYKRSVFRQFCKEALVLRCGLCAAHVTARLRAALCARSLTMLPVN